MGEEKLGILEETLPGEEWPELCFWAWLCALGEKTPIMLIPNV